MSGIFKLKYKNSAFPFRTEDDNINKLEESLKTSKQTKKTVSGGGGVNIIPSRTMTSTKLTDTLPKGIVFGGGGNLSLSKNIDLNISGGGSVTKDGLKGGISNVSLTHKGKKGSFTIGAGKRGLNISKTWNIKWKRY